MATLTDIMAQTRAHNRELLRLLTKEVYEQGDLSAIDRCIHPSYVSHAMNVIGPAGLKQVVPGILQAFEGLTITHHLVVTDDHYLAVYSTVGGKQVGPLMGTPATGQPIYWDVMNLYRIQDGKLIEHWDVMDGAALERQLTGQVGQPTSSGPKDLSANHPATPAIEAANQQVVLTALAAFNQRDFTGVAACLADSFVVHSSTGDRDRTAFLHQEEANVVSFPDLRMEANRTVTEGDYVFSFVTASGTHQQSFMNIAPTHNPIRLNLMSIDRVRQGQLTERWGIMNGAALLRQLQPADKR